MQNSNYTLRYLPVFYDDLEEAALHIANELMNPTAANALIDAVEASIEERLPFAESFEQFHSKRERKNPYYRIYVGNFTIYYVVIEDEQEKVMEVRRFLYNRRDVEQIL